jgi:hypothetical protein
MAFSDGFNQRYCEYGRDCSGVLSLRHRATGLAFSLLVAATREPRMQRFGARSIARLMHAFTNPLQTG